MRSIKFSKDHIWVMTDDDMFEIGLSHYAIKQLGNIISLELPEIGDSFAIGEPFATVEAAKTVSDLYAPIGGKVIEINESLLDSDLQNLEDEENIWLIKVDIEEDNPDLLTLEEYEQYIEES